MLLQEMVKDWNSGILDIYNSEIKITGFMSSDGLLKYYNQGLNCIFGMGLYPVLHFDTAYAQDNGLWIILEEGKEVSRSQFIPILKDNVTYKDIKDDNKIKSKVFTIRKCKYTNQYNFQDTEKSLLFDTLKDLKCYFKTEYNTNLLEIINNFIEIYLSSPTKRGRISTRYVNSISDNLIRDETVAIKDEESKSDIEKQLEAYRLELEDIRTM